MFLLAIITGTLTLMNYFFLTNQTYAPLIGSLLQVILLALTLVAAVKYRGQRQRHDYAGRGYQIFSLRFSIILLACLGNIAVLIVVLLNLFGGLKQF
ncbi:hypothetical protein [Loigolactobacillus zhaoyuanensis]|uniref:Uncharacterized protein n=1 Tax=Loigolactobacillus zhaoyuanensis TaxID=2486017 RepID=A0ABW8U9G2_9LACO|nr:hypothetical protein [Loigolactobacillus zhaoyuanensis]